MSKIFLISCIIAATCVDFRQAEPLNIFDPLGSITNLPNQISKGIQGVVTGGKEHIRHIEDGANKLGETLNTRLVDGANKLGNLGTGLLGITANDSACLKVYDDVRCIIKERLSTIESCLTKGTELSGVNIQNLIQSIQDVWKSLEERAQAVMQCFQNISTNIKENASCFAKALNPQFFVQLPPKMIGIFSSIARLYMSFPTVQTCIMLSSLQSGPQQFITLMSDVVPCMQSLMIRLG